MPTYNKSAFSKNQIHRANRKSAKALFSPKKTYQLRPYRNQRQPIIEEPLKNKPSGLF